MALAALKALMSSRSFIFYSTWRQDLNVPTLASELLESLSVIVHLPLTDSLRSM